MPAGFALLELRGLLCLHGYEYLRTELQKAAAAQYRSCYTALSFGALSGECAEL